MESFHHPEMKFILFLNITAATIQIFKYDDNLLKMFAWWFNCKKF